MCVCVCERERACEFVCVCECVCVCVLMFALFVCISELLTIKTKRGIINRHYEQKSAFERNNIKRHDIQHNDNQYILASISV